MTGKTKVMYNIPNMLCYARIAYLPIMIALFYWDTTFNAWLNVFLFGLAGLSDFMDGRIARATGQTTLLGKFLDSSTDKMLVGVALMLLVAFHRLEGVWIIPAILIFLREILIAGVREFMALYNVIVHISKLGKWKLTVQMLSIGFLIVGPHWPIAHEIGRWLFLFACFMTVISGWDYMKKAWVTIQELDNQPEKQA